MADEDKEVDYSVDYWQKLKETCENCRERIQDGFNYDDDKNSTLQFEYLKKRLSKHRTCINVGF